MKSIEKIKNATTGTPMLYDWLDMWLELYQQDINRPHTIDYYEYAIKRIKRYMSNMELTVLNEFIIRAFVKELMRDGFAKSTIASCLSVFKQSFEIATENKYIPFNPATRVKTPKNAPRKKVHALSVKEEKLVIEACEKLDRCDIFIFLLYTGLRREEVSDLKWSDYLESDQIIFIPKSKTAAGERFVPLNNTAIEIINRQPRINNWIFNHAKGRPHTEKSISRLYHKIQDETGIMNFTTHVCRHTFATRSLELGMDLKTLSQILGHSDVAFTLSTYVTIDIQHMKQEMNVFNARSANLRELNQ